jgi:hypothetical protein
VPALWLYQNQNCDITLALAQSLPSQNQSLFNLYFYLLRQLLNHALLCHPLPLTPRHTHLFPQSYHLAGIIPYHIDRHIIIAIPSHTTSTHTSTLIQHIFKFKTHSFISHNHKIRHAWPTLTYS